MARVVKRAARRGSLAAVGLACLWAGALGGCGGDPGPATGAARLVPADALVYLHLSTDSSRHAVQSAARLAAGFPGYPRLRDALLRRLSTSAAPLDERRDLHPWLGREAALALATAGAKTASSLILLDVRDPRRAHAFLTRGAGAPRPAGAVTGGGVPLPYRGVTLTPYGAVYAAFVGHYLALGPAASVRRAIDVAAGRARSLASNPTYRRATAGAPADRVLDGYLSADGIRRLLSPQAGVLGAAGTLLDQAALHGTGLALSSADGGARLRVKSVLDPARRKAASAPFRPFAPTLDAKVPAGALAYLGVAGLDRAAGRLIAAAGNGRNGLASLLARARVLLARSPDASLGAKIASLFSGEVAVWIAPHVPAPTLAVVARARDQAGTRLALAQLQAPLAQLFAPPTSGGGVAPVFEQRRVGGVDAVSLRLTPTLELDYAVFGGELVIATSLDAIAQVSRLAHPLSASSAYHAVLGGHPSQVGSLVFLDLSQLLRLAELTGLNQSPTYLALRNDLQRVRAVGESSFAEPGQTTAELFFQIR